MRVAIIGAGMTGAAAAAALQQAGVDVTVFEKARGPGGRMSSKRALDGQLDLGAQYFTARDPAFQAQLAIWLANDQVQPWLFQPYVYKQRQMHMSEDQIMRYVGVPGMHQPVKALLNDIKQHYQCHINELSYQCSNFSSQHQGEWVLSSEQGESYAGFDALIVTCPPAQAAQLLQSFDLPWSIPTQALLPCWAVLLELVTPSQHQAEGIFVEEGPICWAAQQSAKPGRNKVIRLQDGQATQIEQWLVHFSAEFSLSQLEAEAADLIAIATLELSLILDVQLEVSSALCHRWLFATCDQQQSPGGRLFDPSKQLIVTGDWTAGGRVEQAWLAGQAAARQLLQ